MPSFRLPGVSVALFMSGLGSVLVAFSQEAPTTWAIVVGVNDYLNYEDMDGGDLRGAEHDALAFRDVLLDVWEIPSSQVTTLLSRDATRHALESAFTDWLPENVKPRDRVIFFFAGHGSQVLDDDGDEADGLDETICPTDVLATSFDRDIRDDELEGWIRDLPTGNVIVVLDSCHSGTGTRMGVGYARTRNLGRGARAEESALLSPAGREVKALAPTEGVLELAGAAPDQYAMDMRFDDPVTGERFYGGAFTTHLVRQIRQAPPGATFQDLFWATYHAMKADRFAQDPQISGPTDAELRFGSLVTAPPEPIRVLSVLPSGVLLAMGGAGPLEPGVALRSETGALLRVEQADGERAVATLVQGRVRVGEVVELLGVSLPTSFLRIRSEDLPDSLDGPLEELARAVPDLTIVRDPQLPADLALRPVDGGDGVGVFARDGSLRARVGISAEALAGQVQRELQLHRLAALRNPHPAFSLEVGILGDENALRAGDPLVFRVRSQEEGYLTLLDLGTDGTLTLLYPNRWSSATRIPGGEEVLLPRAGDDFTLRAAPPSGLGMVRAIVTLEPLPLPGSDEAFLRSRSSAELVQAVRGALLAGLGTPTAPGEQPGTVRSDQWASALATYRILAPDSGGS